MRGIGAAVLVVWLAACASISVNSSDEDKRKVATERASTRWVLIIKGDPGAAYDEFMSAGSRLVITRGEFVERMRTTAFRTATVDRVECGAQSCQLSVPITYDHKLMKGVPNTLRENWIIEKGNIWYVWSP